MSKKLVCIIRTEILVIEIDPTRVMPRVIEKEFVEWRVKKRAIVQNTIVWNNLQLNYITYDTVPCHRE